MTRLKVHVGSTIRWDNRMKKLFVTIICILFSGHAYGDIIPPNRAITWQGNVGVEGGIPNRTTICTTVDSGLGDDSSDAASAINSAISGCPANQVVKIPNGTYRVYSDINLKTGIVIRGNGPGLTKIHSYGGSGDEDGFIRMYGTSENSLETGSGINITNSTGQLVKGTTSLTLSGASSITVGGYVGIDQTNDGTLITIGESSCSWCGRSNGTRSMGQMAKVTGKAGNVITIEPGLHYDYNSSRTPQVVWMGTNLIQNVGLEDLEVENKRSSGWPYANIYVRNAANWWIKNVYSAINGGRSHIETAGAFRGEIRDSRVAHQRPRQGESGGSSSHYGIVIGRFSTANVISNNIFEDLTTGLISAWGASGNVFAYNYFADFIKFGYPEEGDTSGQACNTIFPHGMHTKMNLTEGNDAPRYDSDFYWGSHSYNTVFRNNIRAYQAAPWEVWDSYRWAIQLMKRNLNFNIVGNVLGTDAIGGWTYESNGPGTSCGEGTPTIYVLGYHQDQCSTSSWDDKVKSTLLRHGNYDYASESTKWCGESGEPSCQGSDQSHAIPDSLYLPAKPAWWCTETPWPPIGSDLTPKVSKIPAQRRYEGLTCTQGFNQRGEIPNSPFNLKVQ